jgi:hypothetical protein
MSVFRLLLILPTQKMTSIPSSLVVPAVHSNMKGLFHDGIRLPNHIAVKSVRTDRTYTPQNIFSSTDADVEIEGPLEDLFRIIINRSANEYVDFSTTPFTFTDAGEGSITLGGIIPQYARPAEDYSFFTMGTFDDADITVRMQITSNGDLVFSLPGGDFDDGDFTVQSFTGQYPIFARVPI